MTQGHFMAIKVEEDKIVFLLAYEEQKYPEQ